MTRPKVWARGTNCTTSCHNIMFQKYKIIFIIYDYMKQLIVLNQMEIRNLPNR
jgi:hypothetical protein